MPPRTLHRTPGPWATLACAALVALGACGGEPAGPDPRLPFGEVAGKVVSPGVTRFSGMAARLRWDGVDLVEPVGADGSFALVLPRGVEGPGALTIEPGPGDGFHPAWVALGRESLDSRLTIVLAPTSWTIEGGAYAGQSVPIDPALAADPSVMPSFWGFYFPFEQAGFEQTVDDDDLWIGEVRAWDPDAFPVGLALDRTPGSGLAGADSVALWANVDQLERALGWDVFRPAPTANADVVVRVDPSLDVPGVTHTESRAPTWTLALDATPWSDGSTGRVAVSSADIASATVTVRSAAQLGEGQLVMHELMHVLGAGHGCAWASLQTYCASLVSDAPTPADVAYLQVLVRMRSLERRYDTEWGVASAVFGERVVTLGLPPAPPARVVFGPAVGAEDFR